ncbi:hypothetical protein NHJ6243_002961 [Beauveria neobassiana]
MQQQQLTNRVARASRGILARPLHPRLASKRCLATTSDAPVVANTTRSHRVVVVGGGSAGSNVSHQLLRSGKYDKPGDIAVVDPAEWHHYQPGWTLVGGGLARKDDFRRRRPGHMGPHEFVARSPLADAAGLVSVDSATLRHTAYDNVWALGDAASLPTSKTAAAITAQAPVLVANLLGAEEGREPQATYDGYTSCPLVTEYGKVLLAEFKYGPEPKETFGRLLGVDQVEPRRAFYHLKKDFFPWVYRKFMVKGTWAGPKGFIR